MKQPPAARDPPFTVSLKSWYAAQTTPESDVAVKRFLKVYTPTFVWNTLRFIRHPLEQWSEMQQLKSWKKTLADAPVLRRAEQPFAVASLTNTLPNSGGLPIDPKHLQPQKIFLGNMANPGKRSAQLSGFEGVALDDALNWMVDFRHYSFVPLASAVAEIARECGGKGSFSVLELGFGSGGFRPLLERFGASAYLGLDANPLPLEYSPHVLASPSSYRIANLQQKIDFNCTFDVICSFEVLEHIREDSVDELIGTICAHMGPKSLFMGTAAFTEEYDVHITVHRREWWLRRFSRFGLVPVADEDKWTALLFRSAPHNWSSATSSAFVLRRLSA
jgi:hypothetical protein